MSWLARVGEETDGTWKLDPLTLSVMGDDDHAIQLQTVSGQRGGKSIKTRMVVVSHLTGGKIDEIWFATEDGSSLDAFWS